MSTEYLVFRILFLCKTIRFVSVSLRRFFSEVPVVLLVGSYRTQQHILLLLKYKKKEIIIQKKKKDGDDDDE
jgi:hypothetical protein